MQSFDKRFNLKDPSVLSDMTHNIRETHKALQKLEAGASATKKEKALSVFLFLSIAGFYPKQIVASGIPADVNAVVMLEGPNDTFAVQYHTKGFRTKPVGLIGTPDAEHHVHMLSLKFIIDTINTAFPRASLYESEGIAEDGSKVFHVTIRPAFMQDSGDKSGPLASGTCVCSDRRVAYMQAFVRMLASYIAMLRADLTPTKTVAELAKEKYGRMNFRDMVKDLTAPNPLFDVLFGGKPVEPQDNGIYKVPSSVKIGDIEVKAGYTILVTGQKPTVVKAKEKFNTRKLRHAMNKQKQAYLNTFQNMPGAEQAWALVEKEMWKAFGVNPA